MLVDDKKQKETIVVTKEAFELDGCYLVYLKEDGPKEQICCNRLSADTQKAITSELKQLVFELKIDDLIIRLRDKKKRDALIENEPAVFFHLKKWLNK